MTDETPTPPRAPGTPPADDDALDEQIAGLLAVEPLDDVTRRRLVTTAVRAADVDAEDPDEIDDEPDRRGRSRLAVLLPVAAAIAIGIVVGALVVTRPDDSTTTAARQDTDTTVAAGGSAPAPQAAANPPALNESSSLRSLGDLGDVTDAGALSQAVAAAQLKDAAAATPTGVCADIPPPDLGLVNTSAAGIGTAAGVPVNVIIGADATGERIAVVLRSEDCLIIRKDLLPSG
jgi:hypothetical protein